MDHDNETIGREVRALDAVNAILHAPPAPANVFRLNTRPIDDVDRAYVAGEFESIAREIEKLPRLIRIHLRAELRPEHAVMLAEAAANLQLIGALYAPDPKDAA